MQEEVKSTWSINIITRLLFCSTLPRTARCFVAVGKEKRKIVDPSLAVCVNSEEEAREFKPLGKEVQ